MGHNVAVLEKGPVCGGISSTFYWRGMPIDLGPRVFHMKSAETTEFVREMVGRTLAEKTRNVRLMINNKYFKYPLDLLEVLVKFPLHITVIMGFEFLLARILNHLFKKDNYDSFESWGKGNFGRTLYGLATGDFTAKVWGMSPKLLSPRLAKQKLAPITIRELVWKLFGRNTGDRALFTQYSYPEKGIGELFGNMAREITEKNGIIRYEAGVKALAYEGDRITRVDFAENGEDASLEADWVVSTMPVSQLMHLFHPKLESETLEESDTLGYRAMRFMFLLVRRPRVLESDWVYLLDRELHFNRITEQKNIHSKQYPPDKTVLCLEICCNEGDDVWKSTDQQMFDLAMEDIKRLKLVRPDEIESYLTKRISCGYPIYGLDFDSRLIRSLNRLAEFGNLISCGRQGLFINTLIHENLEMGFRAAAYVDETTAGSFGWYGQMKEYIFKKMEGKRLPT
jgi:protoporphyrinogen oxidase